MADRALLTKKLGRYDILRVLGKGAMGVVYEARDPNLNRRVAIKVIGVDTLSPEEAADYEHRFRTEAHSAARLQHPNIVSVYDSDRDGETPYMVMEYVDGKDLKRHLDNGQRYTLEQSVRMMCDLLSALEYAHNHKVVHRDIKPANMLIEASGRLKLTDFGVARIQDSGDGTRTQGGMVGTLKYMSPEQVDGKPVDAASDMFSVGIVLYQLLTDRRPFDGNSYFAIATQITSQEPPAPSTVNGMLPVELDAVLAKALAKEKGQRYASAIDFALALQAAARSADPTIVPSANPYKSQRSGSTIDERSGSTVNLRAGRGGGSLSTITQELELVYWKDVKDSDDLQDLEGFLRRFPEGVYADLAKRRLKRIAGLGTEPGQMLYEQTEVVSRLALAPGLEPNSGADDVTVPAIGATALLETVTQVEARPTETSNAGRLNADTLDDPDATLVRAPVSGLAPIESGKPPEPEPARSFEPSIASNLDPVPVPEPLPVPAALPASDSLPKTELTIETAAEPAVMVEAAAGRRTGLWLGLAGAIIAVGAATWFWRGSDNPRAAVPTDSPAVAASAATPTSASASAPASASVSALGASAPASAASAATAAGIANPDLAASASAPTASTAQSPNPTASVPKASTATVPASVAVSAPGVTRVSPKPVTPASGARPSGRDGNQRPVPTAPSVRLPAAEPEPSTRPPSGTQTVPPGRSGSAVAERPAPEPVPTDPREVCKGKFMFAFGSCMTEQCALPRLQNHPACVEIRDQIERRRNIEQAR